MRDVLQTREEFAAQMLERLRPAVQDFSTSRRRCLRNAVLAGIPVFAVFFLLVYFAFTPYDAMLREGGVQWWPLLLLLPAILAVLAGTIVFIVSVPKAAQRFREAFAEGLGAGVDPDVITTLHASATPPKTLFGADAAVEPAPVQYRGACSAGRYDGTLVWVRTPAGVRAGVWVAVRCGRDADKVRAVLNPYCAQTDAQAFVVTEESVLHAAILRPAAVGDTPAAFLEKPDIDKCYVLVSDMRISLAAVCAAD